MYTPENMYIYIYIYVCIYIYGHPTTQDHTWPLIACNVKQNQTVLEIYILTITANTANMTTIETIIAMTTSTDF